MLSEKLLNLRKENNMTQEAVAEAIDVSRQTISNWENGTSVPTIANTKLILSLYGKSLSDIESGPSTEDSLLKEWIGVLCSIQTVGAQYSKAMICEVDGLWATIKVIERKKEDYIIYNVENIIGLRRLD